MLDYVTRPVRLYGLLLGGAAAASLALVPASGGEAQSHAAAGGGPSAAVSTRMSTPVRIPPPRRSPLATASTHTVCRSIALIGDSLSKPINDRDTLPSMTDSAVTQLNRVGVVSAVFDASGGRSAVETVGDQLNAVDAIRKTARERGPVNCWIIAIGTNDAANIAVGGTVTADQRIDAVMSAVGTASVLWPTVHSNPNPANAAYAPENMAAFNAALARAAGRYPNLRVYDFATAVDPTWHQADGVHFTAAGTAARNRMIADALVRMFPAP